MFFSQQGGVSTPTLSNISYIDFNTSIVVAHQEGRLHWNSDDGTLEIGMPGGNVNLQIGQEMLIRVKASEDIDNGELIYIDGADGTNPTASLANASEQNASKTLAMATEDITSGQKGFATAFGLVRDVPVPIATYSDGDPIYLDSTSGKFTKTKLNHPNFRIKVGYVLRAHNTEGVIFLTINGDQWLKRMQAQGEPTGYDGDQSQLVPDISISTRTISVAVQGGETYFNFWSKGREYRKTSTQQTTIADTTGLHFISFDADGVLQNSMTPWQFGQGLTFTAIVYWYQPGGKGLLLDERHLCVMDWATHKYLHETVSTRYESGLTGTFNDNGSFTITAGEIHDEDIEINIAQKTDCTILYRDGSLDWNFDIDDAKFYKETADIIQYDNAGTLTDVPNSSHVSYYIFGTNDTNDSIWSVMGQRTDGTLANAILNQNPTGLALGTLPSPEMKLLYQVIIKRTTTSETVERVVDYREASTLVSGDFVGTSHQALSDLELAANGKTYGHIDDQAQTIAGAKTFSGAAVFSSTAEFSVTTTFTGAPTFNSGIITPLATKTADYPMVSTDQTILADGSGASVDITAPIPSLGRKFTMKAIDISNAVRILPYGAETFDGAANYTFVAQYESRTYISDGTNWFAIASIGAILL